ncbi:hypothetical protein NEMBOFW57_006916 [Staphylotrichum longicolle]|uniref:Uncharacterized protein n=1 Tax=Staphylotrichum longicolle TaxID=669026 RepID=A0AAD4EUH8_9PEZI|nr:hypothetical protein NEMBOFW57_006916 [Staphylotrichum longicolle]
MVGKVWEFCKKGAFKGFHAGGGQGYNVSGSTVTETTGDPWGSEPDAPVQSAEDTPMVEEAPAYAPQPAPAPYSPVYRDVSTPDSTPRPAAKRRQVSANNNDELRNWVVVDEPSNQTPIRFAAEVKAAAARPSGLARPRSGYYSQTSATSHRRISAPSQRFTGGTPTLPRTATRPPLRISHAASPSLPPREPASFASPRASPATHSTPSRIPVPVQPSPQQSHNPNPFAFPGTPTTASAKPSLKPSTSRPSSRQTHTPRHSLSTSTTLRPSSPSKPKRLSLSTGPAHHRRNQSSASATSSSTTTTTTTTTAATGTATGPGTSAARRQAATTSPRLDAEARQLAQRKLAAERDADARVDAFNAKLLSMIRQGREALGTRVEVEEMGEEMDFMGPGGEGWEDDE